MKRKNKRKNDSNSPKTPEISRKKNSKPRQGDDSKQNESGSASRSASQRRRRSLSSLFKRSRDRQKRDVSESSDRSRSRGISSGGVEVTDTLAYNPKTEPRDHLRRMTVREALADSRTRGRSPNRRAIYNLEKQIMSPGSMEDNTSVKSLSSSLPHIPDQIATNSDELVPITNDNSGDVDLTLTRSGKRRGYSEGRVSSNDIVTNKSSPQNKENFLPLDKRKYIINKDAANLIDDRVADRPVPSTSQVHTAEVHSPHSSRDPSPYSASAFANQERSRRESFAKFLELRETRPRRSTSNMSIGRMSIDSQASSDDHQALLNALPVPEPRYVPPGNVSVLKDGTKVVLPTYDEAMATPSFPEGNRTLTTSPASRFQQVNTKITPHSAKSKLSNKGTTDNQVKGVPSRSAHDDRKGRSTYISPRRFSKGSRKSNSSNRSVGRNESIEETITPDKTQVQTESAPKRYLRKFSSSSEKSKRKLSNQSDVSRTELMAPEGTAKVQVADPFESFNSKLDNFPTTHDANIQNPKPNMPLEIHTDNIDGIDCLGHDNDSVDSDLNTGLNKVANQIKEAMDSVNVKPQVTQFPNNDFTAVPLDSITNDAPFNMIKDGGLVRKGSDVESNSRSKSRSTSKQYSSTSDTTPNDVEDMLLKDDVFETNIDDISLKSEGKCIVGVNETPGELGSKVNLQPGSKHSSVSKDENIEETEKGNEILTKGKEVETKRDSKKKKKRKSKTEDTVPSIEEPPNVPDSTDNQKIKSKKSKKERKKSSKKARSMSAPNEEVQKMTHTDAEKPTTKQMKNDKIMKVDDIAEKDIKPKSSKRKSFFRRNRHSETRAPSIQDAIVKVGRAASLSNILGTPELSRAARKPSLAKTDSLKRSHSVEEISSLRYNKIEPLNLKIPDSIFTRRSAKNAIWNIETELPKPKEKKGQPKLSLSAIISLRAKVGRFKKAKQAKDTAEAGARDSAQVDDTPAATEENIPDTEQLNENSEARDRYIANIVYENELNSSLNKPHDTIVETALIEDDLDNETTNIIHEKKIHFDSYLNDQLSEEELIKQRQRNTRLTDRRESKVRIRQKKVISCCKKLIAFLFSHIGLCSLVVAYCVAGGFIFKYLEGSNELEHKKEMQEVRMNYTNQIFSLAFQNQFTKQSAEEFKTQVIAKLKEYGSKIYRETKEAGWDGKDSGTEPEQWSFPSSLLYAITVMTTIGYGHVAPKTDVGRIVTIGYAVLGIPLTLLCLTNIGDVMAKGFRILYGKVCCGLCCLLFRPSRRRPIHDPEKGLPVCEERMVVQEEAKSEELVHVPTSVCLLLMSAYILLGTWAFCTWEDWDLVTGTYFCFITLSTIGFGDVVPGMTSDKWDMNEKLVLCGLYLILGLSLIAMCFNLVQEDVKAKCKWLGMKLGIIDKPVTSV